MNGYTLETENLLYFYQKVGPISLTLNIVIYTDDETDPPNIAGYGLTGSPTTECDVVDTVPSMCIAPFIQFHDIEIMNCCAATTTGIN